MSTSLILRTPHLRTSCDITFLKIFNFFVLPLFVKGRGLTEQKKILNLTNLPVKPFSMLSFCFLCFILFCTQFHRPCAEKHQKKANKLPPCIAAGLHLV